MRKLVLFLLFLLEISLVSAQNKSSIKFGKIVAADFAISSPIVDSNSNAVVISDVGSTEFVGNNTGDFTLVFKEQKRFLLQKRSSFDAATVRVPIYIGNNYASQEKFDDFEASTYNIENGQVIETKLEKSAVFTEKVNRERVIKKFTFPNLKEGCIIEYKFTVKSPFYRHLRSWYFQDEYPCLWSEYRVTIPPMFGYFTTQQGYLKYTIDSIGKVFKNYSISEPTDAYSSNNIYRFSGDAKFALWAIKDIPAFKTENFTSSARNYANKIEFLLESIRFSEDVVHRMIKSWPLTIEDLMKDSDFGLALSEPSSWASDLSPSITNEPDKYVKANKIFQFVRDNFTCNDHDGFYLSQPIKKTFQSKSGNVADINLLLTYLFISQGFDAHPVLLSTRDNGFVNEVTPVLSQYNYVISRIKVDNDFYLLDASYNRLGFGRLPEQCFNNSGRLIDKIPELVILSPDSLKEEKKTTLFIINSETGGMQGSMNSTLGYYESFNLREKMVRLKKEDLLKEIKKGVIQDIKIDNLELDSLNIYEEPVGIKYDMKMDLNGEDILYFNPMMGEAITKNPFISAERFYPVEMPSTKHEIFILNMEVPKGYILDEIPKSVRYKLNEDEGLFEYIVAKSSDKIQMRCRIDINKAKFMPEDYQPLREFFSFIIKKQGEQIVFKKSK